MSAYNSGRFIKLAIQSILDQTFRDFEFIIANDGSTDDTESIIKSFSDPRIVYLSLPHRGIVPTVNDGIKAAKGEWIVRMDSDDIAMPNRIADQIKFLADHKDIIAVGAYAKTINEAGEEIGVYTYPPVEHKAIKSYLRKGNAFINPTTVFKKAAFDAIGGYRMFLHAEDYELWTRMLSQGVMANIPQPLLYYRIHTSSITGKNRMRMRCTDMFVRFLALFRTL